MSKHELMLKRFFILIYMDSDREFPSRNIGRSGSSGGGGSANKLDIVDDAVWQIPRVYCWHSSYSAVSQSVSLVSPFHLPTTTTTTTRMTTRTTAPYSLENSPGTTTTTPILHDDPILLSLHLTPFHKWLLPPFPGYIPHNYYSSASSSSSWGSWKLSPTFAPAFFLKFCHPREGAGRELTGVLFLFLDRRAQWEMEAQQGVG